MGTHWFSSVSTAFFAFCSVFVSPKLPVSGIHDHMPDNHILRGSAGSWGMYGILVAHRMPLPEDCRPYRERGMD